MSPAELAGKLGDADLSTGEYVLRGEQIRVVIDAILDAERYRRLKELAQGQDPELFARLKMDEAIDAVIDALLKVSKP